MTTYNTKLEDFKNTYFDYPELSRIVGEPTLGALITLCNEIKANAQTVESKLSGGEHGHLGLVLLDVIYTSMPNTVPYIRPILPVLDIGQGDTQFLIAEKRH